MKQMLKQEQCSLRVLRRKPLKQQITNRQYRSRKNKSVVEKSHLKTSNKEMEKQKLGHIFNYPNVSLIAENNESSENYNNNSYDSIDRIIKEVDSKWEPHDHDDDDTDPEINFSDLHIQYERLIGKKDFLETTNPNSRIHASEIKSTLKHRLEEVRDIRKNYALTQQHFHESTSRILGNNLEDINEEYNNSNIDEYNQSRKIDEYNNQSSSKIEEYNNESSRVDEEEELIEFVKDKPINISKIVNQEFDLKKERERVKEHEHDDVVEMLNKELAGKTSNIDELDEEASEPTTNKKYANHQILHELEEYDATNALTSLHKREDWVTTRTDRSHNWKNHQIKLITKMKQILTNPFIDWSDQDPSD